MFFKKFFGKKNDGFYLQLEDDDAKSTSTAKAPAKTPAKADLVVPPAAPAAVAPAAVAAAPAAKADPKQVKADKKAAQAAKKAEAPKAEPAPTPVAAPPQPTITNFATDYLIKPSSNSGRRRPGANMRQFVDLARQMEKPKAFKAAAAERKPEKPSVEKPSAEKPTTEKAAESNSK